MERIALITRREFVKRSAVTGVAFTAVPSLLLAACSSTASQTTKSLVLRLSSDPTTFQWALTNDPPNLPALLIATSLVTVDKNGTPIPRLALSWQVSDDRTTYTFKLGKQTWSDGKPVGADDVKFSIEQVLLPLNPFGSTNWAALDSVDAPDSSTVVIHLKWPQDLFPALAPTFGPIVPKHIYEGTDIKNSPANMNPVVAGPYKLGKYDKGSAVTLVRNPYWTGAKLWYDQAIYRIIPDTEAAVLALQRGEIDIIPQFPQISPRDLGDFQKNAKFQVVAVASPNGEQDTLLMNGWIPPLNNKLVRQAIAYAIDRKALASTIYLGTATVAEAHMSHQGLLAQYGGDFLSKYNYDPQKATALLDQAGYRAGAGGVRFNLKYTGTNLSPSPQIQDAIVSYLKAVGVNAQADVADFNTHWARVYGWKAGATPWNGYHLAQTTSQWTSPPNLNAYYDSSRIGPGTYWNNAYDYKDPAFDTAINTYLRSAGPSAAAALNQAQQILAEDLPTVPLTQIRFYVVAKAGLHRLPMGYGIYPETPLPPFDVSTQ